MAGGWNKVSDTLTERLLFAQPGLWSKDHPCPHEVACIELALLAARRHVPLLSIGDLERRWSVSRRQVRRVIDIVGQDAVTMGHPWADDFRPDKRPDKRTGKVVIGWALGGVGGRQADGDRTGCGRDATPRARASISDSDADSDPNTHSSARSGQATEDRDQRTPPHRPNFGDKPQPPPDQLTDRDAFIERWNGYAEEFYPGQPSQRWEATTINGKRHRNPGMFASPKDAMREQAMLEHGDHLLPMLDRYAECCRGGHGAEALRAFERGDFEGPKMLAALRLWVTTGKAPFWAKGAGVSEVVTAAPAKPAPVSGWT